jgi:hypothetical protein
MAVKIPSEAWSFFKDVPKWSKTLVFLFVFVFAGFVIYALYVKKEDPVPTLNEQQKNKKAIQDADVDIKKDSIIANYKRLEKIEKGEFREEISKECVRIQQRLKYCTRVDYWKVIVNYNHETRKVKPLFAVLISSSDDFQFDFKDEVILGDGYFYFAERIMSENTFMVDDVSENGHIYYNRWTKNFLERYSTKSLMGASVSGDREVWYLVSFSFSETYPKSFNNNLNRVLSDFRRFVKKRQ